jgi:hypothetical protein
MYHLHDERCFKFLLSELRFSKAEHGFTFSSKAFIILVCKYKETIRILRKKIEKLSLFVKKIEKGCTIQKNTLFLHPHLKKDSARRT